MPGAVRPYTLTDVLQTIYGAATGQSGVSTSTPTNVISLVGEADEQLSMADIATGISKAPGGWNQAVYGGTQWS
jgi:hypothetical protein